MPTLREWKERRPASDIKQTVEFYHPAFGYYRVVNNLFRPATFGGNAFEPARFSVTETGAGRNGSDIHDDNLCRRDGACPADTEKLARGGAHDADKMPVSAVERDR